jgi:thioredoxin-related protein
MLHMRAPLAAMAAALVLGLASHGFGRAGIEPASRPPAMELVVFEHSDCSYCEVFRDRIAPQYRQSTSGAQAPLRFIDISRTGAEVAALKAPISMVPTAVVLKDGREVDRIAGYWAPDNFFKMVAFIIDQAE